MAPRVGFEPTTLRLTAGCSAVELPRNVAGPLRERLGARTGGEFTRQVSSPARRRTSQQAPHPSPPLGSAPAAARARPRSAFQVLLEERQRPGPRLPRGVGLIGGTLLVHERVARPRIHV